MADGNSFEGNNFFVRLESHPTSQFSWRAVSCLGSRSILMFLFSIAVFVVVLLFPSVLPIEKLQEEEREVPASPGLSRIRTPSPLLDRRIRGQLSVGQCSLDTTTAKST